MNYEPSSCILESINLVNFAGTVKNVTNITEEFSFEEDIFMSCMVGYMTIVEQHDFQQNFPLIGEEKVQIKYRTTEDMPLVELEFSVYVMSNRVPVGSSMFGYTLKFASSEFLKSRSKRITRPLVKTSVANAVKLLLSSELDSKKPLTVDKTTNTITYLPTRMAPLQVINLLTARAKSDDTGNFGFLFFETARGFNLRSLDALKTGESQKYQFLQKRVSIVGKDLLRSIDSVIYDESNNVLDRLDMGMFGTNTTFFDPLERTASRRSYSYFNDKQYGRIVKTVGEDKSKGFQTEDFEFGRVAKESIVCLTDRTVGTSQRQMMINLIEYGNKITISIAGNSTLAVGDLMDIEIPSVTGEDIILAENDRYLSGKWLVTAIHHKIKKSNYQMTVQLAKDSYSDSHERNRVRLEKRIP